MMRTSLEKRKSTTPARNESAAPPVGLVGKQSPYNPGEI
ncbi:hypothetical protein STXM2123_1734 [Streptomyces sp. F-3]|nr:hypothetical protein STXM2123_1734 [Streptomyces sp. F-3]